MIDEATNMQLYLVLKNNLLRTVYPADNKVIYVQYTKIGHIQK